MSRIDEVDLVLIINGKIVNLSKEDERRVKILSRKYWDDSIPENPLENDVIIDDRTEEEIEIGMPMGMSAGEKFLWRQDHGLTTSSEDAFGF